MTIIYRLVLEHVKAEFERLRQGGHGLASAAREAEYRWDPGLKTRLLSNGALFRRCVDELPILALEEGGVCHAMSRGDLRDMDGVWTVDSPVVESIEVLCGHVGVDLAAENVVATLGRSLKKPIPTPRVLAHSMRPFEGLEITDVCIDPDDAGGRVDLCWRKAASQWSQVVPDLWERGYFRQSVVGVWIATSSDIRVSPPDMQVLYFQGWCYVLPSSPVQGLLDALGMSREFVRWLSELLERGEISREDRPRLKERLKNSAPESADELLARLVMPFDKRFGRAWFRHFREGEED